MVTFIAVALQMISVSPSTGIKAAELTDNEEDFVIKDGVLTKYVGVGGDVVVPDGVVAIDSYAFDCIGGRVDNVISVTLPDTVTSIGNGAFRRCKNLKSINMSDSVTSIGRDAFWGCEKLMEISSLDGVKSIGSSAFGITPWLDERRKEDPIVVINGILIDGQTCEGDVIIPNTVTTIVGSAFQSKELTSITIPDSVTDIGVTAFAGSRNLVTVKMADSVESVGEEAFRDCIKLKNVRLSNSLKVIEKWTFANCRSLTQITIPYSVSKIDEIAFRGCKSLKYVTISYKITSAESDVLSPSDKCPNITIYGLEKSYIQSYAKENNIPFKPLAIAVTKKTLAVGDKYTLKMNSLAGCTWKSSNKSIATVDSYGKVTAKKKRKVTITANLYGRCYQCVVTIN